MNSYTPISHAACAGLVCLWVLFVRVFGLGLWVLFVCCYVLGFVWLVSFFFFFNCKSNSWCYEENSSLFCVRDFLEMRVSSILLGENVGRRDERCLAYKVKPPKVFLNITA